MHSDARKGMIEAQVEDFICNFFFFGLSGNNSCEDLMKFLDTIPMKSLRVNRLFLELPFK